MNTALEKNDTFMKDGQSTSNQYHGYPVVCKENAKLSQHALSPEQRESAWNQLRKYLYARQSTFLGFQANQSIGCDEVKPFFDMAINNDGDPFSEMSLNAMNTKIMECSVLDYFAKLWRIQQSVSLNEEERTYWGYVTSMGCTEGNLLALYNARDYLAGMPLTNPNPDADRSIKQREENDAIVDQSTNPLVNASILSLDPGYEGLPNTHTKDSPTTFTPVVFFSEASYHGHVKALRMLQMKTFCEIGSGNFPSPLKYPDDYPTSFNEESLDRNGWPRAVPVEVDGSISIPCLVKLVTAFVSRGYPPLVVFTSGTTFKGAYDNPKDAISRLVPILKQHNMYQRCVYSLEDPTEFDIRNGFWFHIDGALGASCLPFLEMAVNQGLVDNIFPNGFPVFDFRIPEVKSIATSLHKWFGCPFPAAVFIMRKGDQVKPVDNPLYIGGQNKTFSGSRGGHSALIIWDLLSKKSYVDLKEIAVHEEQMVRFSLDKFQALERELDLNLWLSHAPGSLFVYFKQPRRDIVRRYSLGSKSLKVKTADGTFKAVTYSHICLMPHVTNNLVLQLIEELRTSEAFPNQN